MRTAIVSRWKRIVSVATSCVGFFLYSFPVSAQVDLGLSFATGIGLGTTDIRTTVARIISYFLGLLGIIAVCIMLYAGFLWMTAGGSEEKISTAKKWMINGVIGLIIIMSAFAITQFILRAVQEGTLGTSGGCLPGQVCGGPSGFGGGTAGAFTVTGVSPAGPGPSNGGWPKNYGITIGFSAEVSPGSVTASSVVVKKCNVRVNGAGEAQAFDLASCSGAVAGTRAAENGRVVFKPNATPGDEPTDFEGDFWYYVQIFGGQVKDARGRSLVCPLVSGDISAQGAPGNLCDRAVAVNNLRDVAPPTVEVNVPRSRPDYCEATIPVQAVGQDDFLVSRIDFTLDGGVENLSSASEVNGVPVATPPLNPFSVDWVTIDASKLAVGEHRLSAKAYDGVPQESSPVGSSFTIPPANCCNAVQDPNETGINCGPASGCGSCDGDACTTGAQCASGACVDGKCVELPIIENVSPTAAGPGTLVTIRGKFFGAAAGTIVFMGSTTGPDASTDDKVAVACATGAWKQLTDAQGNPNGVFEVVVAVPEGAVDGPIKVTTASGSSDTTELETPSEYKLDFDVNTTTLPGICSLAPSIGSAGSDFTINGTGFGDNKPDGNPVKMGANDVSVQTWTSQAVASLVPSIRENTYQVKVRVGTLESNSISFAVRPPPGQEKPEITEIVPNNAPPGAYVTVQGRGFGSSGTVKFFFGTGSATEVAIGGVPACSDFWHNNYVVIKVPDHYECNATDPKTCAINKAVHKVQIVTSNASLPPTNLVDFTVNNAASGPGLCSISPSSGPAGIDVVITGEGFGNIPDSELASRVGPIAPPDPPPLNVAQFYLSATQNAPALLYRSWGSDSIAAYVPGSTTDKSTWPKTGPVSVVADGDRSTNSVPFIVADCNDEGGDAFCKKQSNDLLCCSSGACDTRCGPLSRNSAFGWRFSTDVLPSLPIVVERASCSVTTLQSPSPFKGSQDACINTAIQVEFNTAMNADSLGVSPSVEKNIVIEECGTDVDAKCPSTPVPVAFAAPTLSNERVLLISPFGLQKKTWYRVTLKATPASGIRDKSGRFLDGDYNEVSGGNYVFNFRVRDDAQACAIDKVLVVEPKFTITHQGSQPSVSVPGKPAGFMSNLIAANCNPLTCRTCTNFPECTQFTDQYKVTWPTPVPSLTPQDDGALSLGSHPPDDNGGFCNEQWQPVTANRETLSKVKLTAEVRQGSDPLVKSGSSDISVKFADPVVIKHGPDCTEACVNTKIYAMFNVPMNGSGNDLTDSTDTLTGNTVKLIKCRNVSCNPPYDSVQPPAPLITMITERVGEGMDVKELVMGIELGTTLEPESFYLVKLKGGTGGIESSSGVTLKGLTDGDWFTWSFRTKDDGTPCVPSRAVIEPANAVLQSTIDRIPFRVTPFGSPDECSAEGQPLNGDSYDWLWEKDGQVISGFLPDITDGQSRINTEPGTTAACSASCLAVGSQNTEPQCGNGGEPEPGEDCEKNPSFSSYCDQTRCLWKGGSPNCGNGRVDDGEQCDCRTVGAECVPVPGCQACLWAGSAQGSSTCGDGFIGDGEACDDRNVSGGDGCSSQCLNEGTLPSCLDVEAGKPCVNFCGNGREEVGEDPGCDRGVGDVAPGCDEVTCLKKGTPACTGPGDKDCCGNSGLPEAGEECESPRPGDPLPEGCTASCLNAGSSYTYDTPSFCRDGSAVASSVGEENKCEIAPSAVGTKRDPFQVIVGGAPSGTDPGRFTGTLTATLDGGLDEEGSATVTLNRPCTPENPGVCAAIGPGLGCTAEGYCAEAPEVLTTYPKSNANNICRNTVIRVSFDQAMDADSVKAHMLVGELMPAGTTTCGQVCSNDLSKPCTTATAATACGQGNTCVDRRSVGLLGGQGVAVRPAGFFARAWAAIVSFVKDLLALAARAATTPELPPDPPRLYCEVAGSFGVNGSEITWSPVKALKENLWYRVFLKGGTPDSIKAANGVNKQADESFYFKTGPEICKIDFVTIVPGSHLFTIAEDLGPVCINDTKKACTPKTSREDCGDIDRCVINAIGDETDGDHPFQARAHPSGRELEAEIVPTEEYAFKWRWSPQPEASSILVEPTELPVSETNGWCEQGEAATSLDCKVDMSAIVPRDSSCGDLICESSASTPENATNCPADCSVDRAEDAIAKVKVKTDVPGFPKNGEAVVQVTADISERRVLKSRISASADVTAMLCKTPWPARKTCPASGSMNLPWDPTYFSCVPGSIVWYPFYDKERDTTFFYCRDGQVAGAEQDDLPELKENVVSIRPGRDVLKEYLFTYATLGPWQKDAIGFRITTNPQHLGIGDWYADQGFRGTPAAEKIDGYDALREGRTVYVNAAARVSDKLYTNVNILSYSDGAQPETTAIFNRLLGNIDMNRNVKDLNYCIDANGAPVTFKTCSDEPVRPCTRDAECRTTKDSTATCIAEPGSTPSALSCSSDLDCRLGTDGKLLPYRGQTCRNTPWAPCTKDADCTNGSGDRCDPGYTCLATKSKMVRDVRRWSDLQGMRETLLSNGNVPTIEAGSFLRAKTNSTWPSWNDALSSALGGPVPNDPINAHLECLASGFDQTTCWNANSRLYQCPKDSHVYEFQSVGGQDFILRVDFEARCGMYRSQGACQADPEGFCQWNGAACLNSSNWSGMTCVERTAATCAQDSENCRVVGGKCDYKLGHLDLGFNNESPNCQSDTTSSSQPQCGDGVLQQNEECEVASPPDTSVCSVTNVCDGNRSIACGWTGVTEEPSAATSTDWKPQVAAANSSWMDIAYGNGLFAAVGGNGQVMTSPDGVSWTLRTAPFGSWYAIAFGNGKFAAMTYDGRVMTSPDGITWTSRGTVPLNSVYGMAYGNGKFVAVSYSGTNKVATSPDGITWTVQTAPGSGWIAATYGNGLFVAVAHMSSNPTVMTSPDGVTWTSRTAPIASWFSVTYGNGQFVAVGYSGATKVMTSPDGINWTARTSPNEGWLSVAYGNGLFAAVAYSGSSNRAMTSPDGITWTAHPTPLSSWWGVAFGNGVFAAVASNGTVQAMTAGAASVVGASSGATSCGANGSCVSLGSAVRAGFQQRTCSLDCTWGDFGACSAGTCGDGVIQDPPEKCDDGTLNGTYGKCNATCTGFAPSCGDGQKQINEACDCGSANGAYKFNGRLQLDDPLQLCVEPTIPENVNSCAWDCSGAGPYCGDRIINGGEVCDGGFQEFKGYCNDELQTGCDTNAQCNFGTCSSGRCVGNQSVICSTNTDCQKTCGNYCPTVEQRRRRLCNGNTLATSDDPINPLLREIDKACRWGEWVCTAPGSCGNGKKETGEECDDGNTDNTDGCIIDPVNDNNCVLARCADTYVSTTNLEQCDLGADNGQICEPEYGLECNFCTSACKTGTVSGGFCGNNIVEGSGKPSGPEECDGIIGIDDWVCVNTKIEYQPIGKVNGDAMCAVQNCKRVCTQPDSKLCFNGANPANLDAAGTANSSAEAGPVLGDSCDPDKDNDGVPGAFDCNDTNAAVRPRHEFPAVGGACPSPSRLSDGKCVVDAATEVCNPRGVDDDCNTLIDNVILVSGKIVDGQSGAGVSDATMTAYCNSTVLSTAVTDASGNYNVAIVDDGRMAPCNKRLNVVGSKSGFCFHSTQAVQADMNGATTCTPVAVPDIQMVSDPPEGRYISVLTWDPNSEADLTVHVRASYAAGGSCMDDHTTSAGCTANGLCLDVNAPRGPGPETYSIDLRSPARYRYYVWGPASIRTTAAKVRVWGNGCSHRLYDIADAGVRSGYDETASWWEVYRIENVSGFSFTDTNLLGSSDPPSPNNCTNF